MKDKTDWDKLKKLSDQEIDEAISEDPDTYSPSSKELNQFKRVTPVQTIDVKQIRKQLQLSQAKFALYFGVNSRTVQEWEQKRSVPSQLARNFLKVVQYAPEIVQEALLEHREQEKNN